MCKCKDQITFSHRNVGINFGCVGVVKRGHKVLGETARVYPYGCNANAREGAEALARSNGWS